MKIDNLKEEGCFSAVFTAKHAKNISDGYKDIQKRNERHLAHIVKMIEQRANAGDYECVLAFNVDDAIKKELENRGFEIIDRGDWSGIIIKWGENDK